MLSFAIAYSRARIAMAHPHTLDTPVRAKAEKAAADAHLERLKASADHGGSGVNLVGMSRDEVRRHLGIGS